MSQRIETCFDRFKRVWTDLNGFRRVSTGLDGLKRVSTGCTNMDTPRMFVDVTGFFSLKIFFVKNDTKKDTVVEKANYLFIEL